MNSKAIVLLFSTLLLILPTNTFAVDVSEVGSISEEGESAIQGAYDASGIPSAQAAIVLNDSLVWAKGYGEQSSLDTVFGTGSITKTFVAAAFVKLNETGEIGLDDDVSDYLPFVVRNPNEPSTVITIRMVLEHKAGMTQYYQFNQPWASEVILQLLDDYSIPPSIPVPEWNGIRLPLQKIINSTNINDPDLWSPSTGGYAYSNTGYFFLSFLLEYITNDTWSNYIHDNILSPLGMDDTKFNVTEYEQPVAIPHLKLDNGTILEFPIYQDYGYGAGAMMTSVTDLSKFLIAVMNGGTYEQVQVFQPGYNAIMKQLLHPNGNTFGYQAQFSTLQNENGTLIPILFTNLRPSDASGIWDAVLDEGRCILNGCPTTTPPPPGPLIDPLVVGLAVGGVVVVAAVVVVIKRR
ncbi:MAG: serine hydrolase domain-containing protein [Candidatus Thorarchaeota archaeon]